MQNPDTSDRCQECGRKGGGVLVMCKCGPRFCLKHRHPEDHACPFDHKAAGREALRAQNPGAPRRPKVDPP